MASYVIGKSIFQTQASLKKYVRDILYRYSDGQYLSDDDYGFMLELLKRHPDYAMKLGVGIKAIFVKQNPMYKNTRCFWLVRLDGSKTDFSYLECLKPTTHEKKFLRCCRAAIELYIQEFKHKFFDDLNGAVCVCPYTNEPLNFIGSHVDHKSPLTFNWLVKEFLSEHKIDVADVQIDSSARDGVFQDTFTDKSLERLWIEYHNSHAELQIISKKANLGFSKQ